VILRSLIGEHGCPEVVWASLAPRHDGAPGRTAHRVNQGNAWFVRPRRLAQAIDALAERQGASAVWIVAHGPILPAIAPLVHEFGRAVHLTVHDDPAWAVVFRTRREFPLTPWVHRSLASAVTAANSVDVISAGMRAEFARRFGIDSVVVHRVSAPAIPSNNTYDRDAAGLSIGILGSVYSPRQIDVLLRAVATASQRARIPGRIVIIGTDNPEFARRAARVPSVSVNFTGHLPEAEGVELLRGVFAVYLGYPFGQRARVLRRTSFPTKLATYLLAARPLLVHTPYDSTLTPLVGATPFTIPWFDDDAGAGSELLLRAWSDESLHVSQHEQADLLRRRYFGSENRTRMFDVLDQLPRPSIA
jgi:hypothetical protein